LAIFRTLRRRLREAGLLLVLDIVQFTPCLIFSLYAGFGHTDSILPILFLSAAETRVPFLSFRLRAVLFLVKMCALYAFLRLIFPLAVFLKRFAAPRLLFIFGILTVPFR